MRSYEVLVVTDLELLNSLDVEKEPRKRGYLKSSIEGVSFKYFPEKVKNFVRSCKCIACGIEGTEVRIEKQKGVYHAIYGKPHLNVYGKSTTYEGKEYAVLMTVDHDVLRSKGGEDTAENFNTMCSRCNQMRGSKWNSAQEFIEAVRGRDLLAEYNLMAHKNKIEKANREAHKALTQEEREAALATYLKYLHVSHVGDFNRHKKKLLRESQQ